MLTDDRLRELWANGFTITVMAGPFIENFAHAVAREVQREFEVERDALRADNERLRELLRDARVMLADYSPLDAECSCGMCGAVRRIDAALAAEEKP